MRLRLLIVAAGLIVGCNKSVGPSDPYAGNWTVDLTKFADSSYFVPATFGMTITALAEGYVAEMPDLEYHLAGGAAVDTYAILSDSTFFSISGDTLFLKLGGSIGNCVMTVRGVIVVDAALSTTASGSYGVRNGCGPNPNEVSTWTATKQ